MDVHAPPGLPEEHPLELPGRGTTSYRRAGIEGAPTLVLLHGWTATSGLNWFTSFPALSGSFDVVAIDHRGHGRGIRSRQRFRLADCADDVVALADALGIDRFVPVGYSMGGPVAQLVWRRHPDRVRGLVLCATSRYFVGGRPGERAAGPMLGLAALAARATPARWHRALGDRFAAARYDETELGLWARQQVSLNDPRMVFEAGQALAAFSSREWIGEIDVPTAVLVTELDTVVPPRRQRAMAAAIDGAVTHPVAGDHGVCALEPDAFVPVLERACTEVTSRAPAPGPRAG
ncbi:MAG TPA: alpha/beta hydrolase [Acidimicrobiales bacterium]|nr:alpha/beta hydrolase [Acidimicrobiales bacterium]